MIDYLKSLFSSTFFDKVVLGNPLEDWLVSLIIIIISFSLSRFIKWLIKTIVGAMVKRTESKCDDLIVNRIQTPIVFSFIISGCKISLSLLTFSESIDLALSKIFIVLATLNVTWFICGLISGILDGMVSCVLPVAHITKATIERTNSFAARSPYRFLHPWYEDHLTHSWCICSFLFTLTFMFLFLSLQA